MFLALFHSRVEVSAKYESIERDFNIKGSFRQDLFSKLETGVRNSLDAIVKGDSSANRGVSVVKIRKAIKDYTLRGILDVNSITYNTRLATANTGNFPTRVQASILRRTLTFNFNLKLFSTSQMVSDLLQKCLVSSDRSGRYAALGVLLLRAAKNTSPQRTYFRLWSSVGTTSN